MNSVPIRAAVIPLMATRTTAARAEIAPKAEDELQDGQIGRLRGKDKYVLLLRDPACHEQGDCCRNERDREQQGPLRARMTVSAIGVEHLALDPGPD